MSTFTNYLIVILIALIILLTFTYSTDYLKINLPFKKDIETSENSLEYNNELKQQNHMFKKKIETYKIDENKNENKNENENEDINNYLIDTNFATIESDNLNNELFIQTDDYQMTENTNNAITNALRNI
jgi:hypothetical protein